MAGLVRAISKIGEPCPPERDLRDKPGDDEWAATIVAAYGRRSTVARM